MLNVTSIAPAARPSPAEWSMHDAVWLGDPGHILEDEAWTEFVRHVTADSAWLSVTVSGKPVPVLFWFPKDGRCSYSLSREGEQQGVAECDSNLLCVIPAKALPRAWLKLGVIVQNSGALPSVRGKTLSWAGCRLIAAGL